MPGPPPTPTDILKLRGSWLANSRSKKPVPSHGHLQCPQWLTKEAKAVWRELVPLLEQLNVLYPVDQNALARYCTIYVLWKRCVLFLDEHGSSCSTTDRHGEVKGSRPYPQARLALQLGDQLLRIETQYGMTPASRLRLQVSPEPTASNPESFVKPLVQLGR